MSKIAILALRQIYKQTQGSTRTKLATQAVRSVSQGRRAKKPPPELEAALPGHHKAAARVLYGVFLFCILLTVASMLGVLTLSSHAAWLTWTRIVIGSALTLEGFLMLTDWRGARGLMLAYLRQRSGPSTVVQARSFFWRSAGQFVGLFGLVWLGLGVFILAMTVSRLLGG
jgi:hypothetical protein